MLRNKPSVVITVGLSVCAIGLIVLISIPFSVHGVRFAAYAQISSISIISVSPAKAIPGSILTIRGSGFDPSAQIYVLFTDRSTATTPFLQSLEVPVSNATAGRLQIMVPAFMIGPMQIQVIEQFSGNATVTSNSHLGFTIKPLPVVTAPPGELTLGYFGGTQHLVQQAQANIANSAFDEMQIESALAVQFSDSNELVNELQGVANGSIPSFSLGSVGTIDYAIAPEDLQYLDQICLVMLQAQTALGQVSNVPGSFPGIAKALFRVYTSRSSAASRQKALVAYFHILQALDTPTSTPTIGDLSDREQQRAASTSISPGQLIGAYKQAGLGLQAATLLAGVTITIALATLGLPGTVIAGTVSIFASNLAILGLLNSELAATSLRTLGDCSNASKIERDAIVSVMAEEAVSVSTKLATEVGVVTEASAQNFELVSTIASSEQEVASGIAETLSEEQAGTVGSCPSPSPSPSPTPRPPVCFTQGPGMIFFSAGQTCEAWWQPDSTGKQATLSFSPADPDIVTVEGKPVTLPPGYSGPLPPPAQFVGTFVAGSTAGTTTVLVVGTHPDGSSQHYSTWTIDNEF